MLTEVKGENPQVALEWLYETLNKRMGPPYNVPLHELYLCVPWYEEGELDFDLCTYWNDNWRQQGNDMRRDYPHIYKRVGWNKKQSILKVFFIHPTRLKSHLVLWKRKFPYPKVSRVALASSLKLIKDVN